MRKIYIYMRDRYRYSEMRDRRYICMRERDYIYIYRRDRNRDSEMRERQKTYMYESEREKIYI